MSLLFALLAPSELIGNMEERRQILRANCQKKPPNPSFIEDADFNHFIVIKKLKLVFCFIPKISCTSWKRTLYKAENNGTELEGDPHSQSVLSRLKHYSSSERKEILRTYYKAMFVREPFSRLLSGYLNKATKLTYMFRSVYPNITEQDLKRLKHNPFPIFVKHILSLNHSTLSMDRHWRSYEQICPCEIDYDFIGHFENLEEEAQDFLKKIGVDHYVSFPKYQPSTAESGMLKYYSQLTREEIVKLGKFYELDFKLFGYEFPGPLQDVLDTKRVSVG